MTIHELGNIESSTNFFLLRNLPRTARVLDIGTRHGSFLKRIHDAGYRDVHGVDINGEAIAAGKEAYPELAQRLTAYSGNLDEIAPGTYDAITMFDVIEHIPAVQPFLKSVHARLNPGGIFIFQTPNVIVNTVWETFHSRSFTSWRAEHCSLQTLYSLKRHLRDAGFTAISIEKFNVVTDHNIRKTRAVFGPLGPAMLRCFALLPLPLYSNFWGCCRRPVGPGARTD